MSSALSGAFKGFGQELLDRVREAASDRISDAEWAERITGIKKATAAMSEAGIDEDTIIKMLQKYWDLRLSEAESFVEESSNDML